MRGITSLTLVGLCLGVFTLGAQEPGGGAAEFRKQRRTIEAKLVSPNLNDRVVGLSDLKRYPLIDTVKVALPYWSKDPSPAVRSTAAEVLFGFKDESALRPVLRAELKKDINDTNAILAAVWLAGASPDEQREFMTALGKLIEKKPATLFAFFGVADWLGTRQDPAAVKALAALTEMNAFHRQFAFRRCVVTALVGVKHPDAVTKLIDLLPDADGEIRGDIIQHLTRLSGLTLGSDQAPWLAWWKEKKGMIQFPDANGKPPAIALNKGTATYYGIPIYAKKLIFILDTSGSMRGQRITNAKKELVKAIESLDAGTSFNLVSFNSELEVWHRGLVTASPDVKAKAIRWVNQLEADGSTFTYDALKATMDQTPEAVYLLTDGQPTGGTIVEPDKIIEAVRQTNRYRRMTVNVIGVNPGPEEGVFSQFMKKLAGENWGQYRRVE